MMMGTPPLVTQAAGKAARSFPTRHERHRRGIYCNAIPFVSIDVSDTCEK